MAVVGAGKFEEVRAAGRSAREANRAHRCLGAAGGHPQHLHRGDAARDLSREIHLANGRRAERGATGGLIGDRRDDLRVGMAVDQRAPGADPVDVVVAVDIDDLGAAAALHKSGRAADRTHRAYGRVHAARKVGDGALVLLA